MTDKLITCIACGTEVGYDTPCPNGCDDEATDLLNRMLGEEE